MTVRDLWQRTLRELQLMTVSGCWELIYAQCFPLPPQNGVFMLGTRSRYVCEAMELRWHKLPEDVISSFAGRPVQVKTVLVDPQ